MKRKTIVYIAGPLNAMAVDYLKNVHDMMFMAERVRRWGYSVYVPALDLLMGLMFGDYEYKDYFDNSVPFLLASDVVLTYTKDWSKSHGTCRERAIADDRNIPWYEDLELLKIDVPTEIDDGS